MKNRKYTSEAKKRFFRVLDRYRKALRSGNGTDIIQTSIYLHMASGDVPKSYKKYIKKAFKERDL